MQKQLGGHNDGMGKLRIEGKKTQFATTHVDPCDLEPREDLDASVGELLSFLRLTRLEASSEELSEIRIKRRMINDSEARLDALRRPSR